MARYTPLALALRPKRWEDFVYNESAVAVLKNILNTDRLPNGLIFSGIRGVGKTTAARIFARALQCRDRTPEAAPCGQCSSCKEEPHPDILEVDGASNGNLEDIKRLLNIAALTPLIGSMKIFIIDEAHNLGRSQASWDALLKALEEPSAHIFWIFCTTQKHKIPEVIQSRLLSLELKSPPVNVLADYIESVLYSVKAELSNNSSIDPKRFCQLLAELSNHSIRDALTLLDKLILYCDETGWEIENALKFLGQDGLDSESQIRFVDYLIQHNSPEIWKLAQGILDKGMEVDQVYTFFSKVVEDLLSVSLGVPVYNYDALLPRVATFESGRLNWIADKVLIRRDTISGATNKEMALKLLVLEICA